MIVPTHVTGLYTTIQLARKKVWRYIVREAQEARLIVIHDFWRNFMIFLCHHILRKSRYFDGFLIKDWTFLQIPLKLVKKKSWNLIYIKMSCFFFTTRVMNYRQMSLLGYSTWYYEICKYLRTRPFHCVNFKSCTASLSSLYHSSLDNGGLM